MSESIYFSSPLWRTIFDTLTKYVVDQEACERATWAVYHAIKGKRR